MNLTELKHQTNIIDIVSQYVTLKKKGAEYVGICPFHDDTKASLQVNAKKQVYACFACGATGDVVDFLVQYGKSIKEVFEILQGGNIKLDASEVKKREAKKSERVAWTQITPSAAVGHIAHYKHGVPNSSWAYHNAEGAVIGYVCRFNMPDGSKEVIPYTFCTDGTRSEWRWQGFGKPRPMYNLHLLAKNPDKTVIIVEGEKCADAINANMDTAVGIAWPGGANAIRHIDWSPLFGRKVILWPDNDEPGLLAMVEIAGILKEHCTTLKLLKVPCDKPQKWDIADQDWQQGELRKFILSNINDIPNTESEPIHEPNSEPNPKPIPELSTEPIHEPIHEQISEPPMPIYEENYSDDNVHFKFLGYVTDGTRPVHCFFSNATKLITRFTTSQMSASSLLDLAPVNFWEDRFPKKGGFDVASATNWLAQVSSAVGIFSDKKIRGRGAWHENQKTIIHTGSHLIVNGEMMRLGGLESKYIYEVGEPLGFSTEHPLATIEANRLMEVTRLLNWERDINAYLLAGWCVVAPICGALKWRPHIWLTGAAGTGKSWVFKNIVRRLLGDTVLAVQGETSEAGLRQSLRHDALPIVFDEAEAEDKKSQERIQTILTLMRAASAEDGGLMAKGSAGGSAVTYRIRSCFAFASIGVGLSQQSDRTRVTVLGLTKLNDSKKKQERWEELCKIYNDVITDDFVLRLQARTLSMVPIIMKNALTFANAAAAVIGEQRAGDQLGALLAGAYSLTSRAEISYEKAVEWVRSKDWTEEKNLDKTRDEHSLFSFLMEQLVKVDGVSGTGIERNIGELILIACGCQNDDFVQPDRAKERLKRLGFKVIGEEIKISNSSQAVLGFLKNTPWSKNHNKILMRIEGAKDITSERFGSGIITRAVSVPLSLLND